MNGETKRDGALDGLRGLSALLVVIYHCIEGINRDRLEQLYAAPWADLGWPDALTQFVLNHVLSGQPAVIIFFVLSGAVLMKSAMRTTDPPGRLIASYLVKRVLRIYPALLVSLLLTFAVFRMLGRPAPVSALVDNILLRDFWINPPTWTMRAELIGSLFLVALFIAFRLGGVRAIAVTGVAIWLVLLALPANPLGVWPCFFLGAMVATSPDRWLAALLPRTAWLLALALVVILRNDEQQVAGAALVMLILYRNAAPFTRILEHPLALFYGRISYSVYLLHTLVIALLLPLFAWARNDLAGGLLLAVLAIVIVTPLAALQYRFVEVPFIKWAAARTRGWRGRDKGRNTDAVGA